LEQEKIQITLNKARHSTVNQDQVKWCQDYHTLETLPEKEGQINRESVSIRKKTHCKDFQKLSRKKMVRTRKRRRKASGHRQTKCRGEPAAGQTQFQKSLMEPRTVLTFVSIETRGKTELQNIMRLLKTRQDRN